MEVTQNKRRPVFSGQRIGKLTYGREEGGFALYHDGRKVMVFQQKGWMNNLRETPERSFSGPYKSNRFLRTQFEYHGSIE